MSHIGLDVGFTGAKAVVFSVEGRILSKSYSDYGNSYKSNLILKNEINPYHILSAVKKVLHQCESTSIKDKPKTIAVSVSGDDIFPADNKGRPIYNVLSAYNHKPVKYRNLILDKLNGPSNIFYQTGQVVETDVLGLPRILWLKDSVPDLFKKTWKFLCWESYINWYLTGFAVTDFSNASRFLTFDIINKRWAKNILDTFGIPENMMPDAVQAGSFIGKIRSGAAEELNLPADLNVVAGGFDQATAALGAGIIEPGMFSLGMGTVFASHWIIDEFIKITKKKLPNNDTEGKYRNIPANTATDSDVNLNSAQNRAKLYPYCSYLIKDRYMGLLCNFNGSNAINWFFDNFAAFEKSIYKNDVYKYFNNQISTSPSNLFFMPHFTGATYPTNDPFSLGACIGFNLSTEKVDILKSLYEGLAFELKVNYLNLLNVSNFTIKSITAVGGSSRSKTWLQIISNILNIELKTLKIDEGGCLACAVLGAVSSGEFSNITEGIKKLVEISDTITPESKNAALFEEKFNIYKNIYSKTKSFSKFLNILEKE